MSTAPVYPTFPQPLPYVPPPPAGYSYGYRYAGLGRRFGAALLDLVILGLIAAVIAIPFGLLASVLVVAPQVLAYAANLFYGPFTLLLFALWIGYFTYFETTSGQTLGKRALDLRVVSLRTGRPPDVEHALLRSVLRIVDWFPAFYFVGFLVAALTRQKQRLGDLVAETVVVRT